jgi:hypothetical protein
MATPIWPLPLCIREGMMTETHNMMFGERLLSPFEATDLMAAGSFLIIWKIFYIIFRMNQRRLSIYPPMRAVYAVNCLHITTMLAVIPQAFGRHRQWQGAVERPLHD